MLGMETMAEGMTDYVVGHDPAMPSVGKTVQALVATRRLEDSTHASHNDSPPCPCKAVTAAVQQVTQSSSVDCVLTGKQEIARVLIHCRSMEGWPTTQNDPVFGRQMRKQGYCRRGLASAA
jgi:hypothetical protein